MNNLLKIVTNFLAVVLLIGLIATPIYFAKNFAKISGVKSESNYLLVSQIEKFPNLSFSQNGQNYSITYTKYGPSQAFLGVFLINNPTNQAKTYIIETTTKSAELFFGENLENRQSQVLVPAGSSVPVSMISENELDNKVVFKISTN